MLHGSRRANRKNLRSISGALAGPLVTLLCVPALAGPEGERVVHGNAAFDRDGATTRITVSDRAIINYESFNIGAGETVQFLQPGSDSRVLNRIQGSDPTRIDGSLIANGQVYIVNRAGVHFGQGALVDVGQLYAAAGNITNKDFLAGVNRFNLTGDVVNHGTIHARQGATFLGRNVSNFGVISAPEGTITMAVGDRVYLGQRGSNVLLDVSSRVNTTGGQVSNAGELSAQELIIGAGDMYAAVLFDQSYLTAQRITVEGGRGTATVIRGTIDATSDTGQGGQVHLLGDRVGVYGATVDASGATGGGKILIGGDYQGQGDVRTAEGTHVSRDSRLIADATVDGHGGTIITWADKATSFYGYLSARGAGEEGHGGFAEVSGKHALMFLGDADLGAENGRSGTILFDPDNITIEDGTGSADDGDLDFSDGVISFDEGPLNTFISEQFLESFSGAVVLQANNNITIQNLSDNSLDLQATTGSVEFIANADGVGGGAFSMDLSDTIVTQGADVTIFAAGITAGGITTNGGNIELISSAAVSVTGDFTTSGGTIGATAGTGNNALTFIGNMTTGGGAVTLSAGNGITLGDTSTAFTLATGGGTFSGNANSDNNTTGVYNITNGVTINTANGNFIYSGANWTIGNTANINTGTGDVEIIVSRSVPVALGNAAVGVNLTAAELARFTTSGTFSVGASGVAPTSMQVQNFDAATGITGNVVLNSSGAVTFVTSQSDFQRGLTVTGGTIAFDAGLGLDVGIAGAGDLALTGANITLGGDVTLNSAGSATFTGDVIITADTTIASAGAVDDDITFDGAIDGDTLGPWDLTVNGGSGDLLFIGAVGGGDPFDVFSATGRDIVVQSGVTTDGDQTYTASNLIALGNSSGTAIFSSSGTGTLTNGITFDGVTELRGDVSISTLGGTDADDITFNFTVDGDGTGPWDLTLAAAGDGDVTVTGDVGGTETVGILTITDADVSGFQAVTATGIAQTTGTSTTFGGAVAVGADGMDLTSGDVTFSSTLSGATGDLRIVNSGTLDLNGAVTVTGGGEFDQAGVGGVTIANGADISADAINFDGAVTLDSGATVSMIATNGANFGSTLDAGDTGLTFNVTGALDFNGAVTGTGTLAMRPGATQSIGLGDGSTGDLTIDAASIANIQAGFSNVTIGTAVVGEHDFDIQAITLNTLIDFLTPAGGSFNINGDINATALTTGQLMFSGSGMTTILNGDIVTGGADIFIDDAVVVDEGLTVLLDSGGGAIEITGTVQGTTGGAAETLNFDAATGTLTIGGNISGSGAADATGLSTVTIVDASTVSLVGVDISGSFTTTNDLTGSFTATGAFASDVLTILATGQNIAFNSTVDTTGAITVTGAAIDFDASVGGASLAATNTGALTFDSTVTLTGGDLTQTGGGTVAFSGSVDTGDGDIDIDDAVTIGAGLTLDSGTGRQSYGSTITGGNGLTFIANGDGVNDGLTFGGGVTGTGTIALRSASTSTSFEVGDGTTGTNVLLDNTSLGQISGFSAVSVGYGGASTHNIELGTADFDVNTTIGAGTGTVTVTGALANTGASQLLQINSSSAVVVNAGGGITTNGGDLELNTGLRLGEAASVTLDTNGGELFINGDVSGTDGGAAEDLTLDAGAGNLTVVGRVTGNGTAGTATSLLDVTITNAAAVDIGSNSPDDNLAAIDTRGNFSTTNRLTGSFSTNGRDVRVGTLDLDGVAITVAGIHADADVFIDNNGVLSIGTGTRGGDLLTGGFFVQTSGGSTGTVVLGGDIETGGAGSIVTESDITLLGDINDGLSDTDDTFDDVGMNAFVVGGNTIQIGGDINTAGFDLTLSGVGIVLDGGAGSINGGDGTNIVRLLPESVTGTIDVGDVVGSGGALQGGLNIRAQEISALAEGFNAIQIGFAGTGEHSIQIGAASFVDAVEFHAPVAGGISVIGTLASTDDQGDNARSIFIDGSGATTTLGADLVTIGGDIEISDNVVIADDADVELFSLGGNIDVSGTITGTAGAGDESITFSAFGGATTIGGTISGAGGAADATGLTIVDFGSADLGVSIQAVDISGSLRAGSGTRIGGLFTTNGQTVSTGDADLTVTNATFGGITVTGGDFVIDNSALLQLTGAFTGTGGGLDQNDALATGSVELSADIDTSASNSDVSFTSDVTNLLADREINAGTGGIDILGAYSSGVFNSTFTANRVDFGGGADSITGTGVLTIRPADETTDIDIGNTTSPGSGLRFGLGDLAAISDGFTRVEFGFDTPTASHAIQIAGVSTVNAFGNETVIHAAMGTTLFQNNFTLTNQNLTVNSDSTFGGPLDISTGTGGQSWNGSVNAQTFNVSLTGNRVDFNGGADSVSGTGSLTLRPATTTTDIDVGNIVGAGGTPGNGLRFGLGDLGAIADGFTAIRFGYAGTGAHNIQVAGINGQTGNNFIFDSAAGGQTTFLNDFRNGGFNLTVNGEAVAATSLEFFTGTGLQAFNGGVTLGANDVTFTGNLVSFDGGADSVTGTGIINIRPATDTTDIDIGNVVAAGGTLGSGLRFGIGDLAALADGFSAVWFGYGLTGAHTMQIGDVTGASAFNDATFFFSPQGGSISVLRNLSAVLDGSLHFVSGAGQVNLANGANITTAGAMGANPDSGLVLFDAPVVIVTGGDATITSGGDVTFLNTVMGSGGATLTVNNAGLLQFNGDVNVDGGLDQNSGGMGSTVELGANITAANGDVTFESLVTLIADMLSITAGGMVDFGVAPFNMANVVLDTGGFDFSIFAGSVNFFGSVIGGGEFVLAPVNDGDAIDVGDITAPQMNAFTVTNDTLSAFAGVDRLIIGRANGAHSNFQVEEAIFVSDTLLRSPAGGQFQLLSSLTNAAPDAGIEIVGTDIQFGAGIFTNNGAVTITGPVTLIADSGVNTIGGNVVFNNTVDGAFGLDVIAISGNRGNVNFFDTIGQTTALTGFSVAGWDVLLSGIGTSSVTGVSGDLAVTAQDDLIFQGGEYNANGQTYAAGDELRIDVVDTRFQSNGSDIAFNIATGTVGDTDGFQGIMLTSRPSLTVESAGGDITIEGGIDATPGGVGLSDVTLAAGAGGVLVGGIIGDNNRIGSVDFSGNTVSVNEVRTNRQQVFVAPGGITLNGNHSTAVVGSGSISFIGNTTLAGNSSVTTAGGALDGILVDGTLNGGFMFSAAAGNGDVDINGVVGGTTALASLNILANNVTLNGIGIAFGAGVIGNTNVAALDTLTFFGSTYTANTQTYAGANGIFIDTDATFRSTDDNITFFNALRGVTGDEDLTINAGTATISVAELGTEADGSDPVAPRLGDIILTADEADLNGSIYGSTILLQPFTNTLAINVGGTDNNTAALDLTATELAFLAPTQPGLGLGSITIGRSGGMHDVTVSSVTFFDPLTIRADGGGTITVAGDLTGDDDASIALNATGGNVFFDASIFTTANDVTVRGGSVVRADSQVNTQGGDILFVGTLDSFANTIDGPFDFALNAFDGIDSGSVNVEAPIGLTQAFQNLTLNGFDTALFRVGTDGAPGVLGTLSLVAFDDVILNGFGYHAGQMIFAAGDEVRIARDNTNIITTGGPIAFNDGIIRLQDGNNVNITSNGGTISVIDGINANSAGAGTGDVAIDAGNGSVEILGAIGDQFAIGLLSIIGADIFIDAPVTTGLGQTYTGPTRVGGGNLTSTSSGVIQVNGDLMLLDDLTITSAGNNGDNAVVTGDVQGDFDLTVSLGSGDLQIDGDTFVMDLTVTADDATFNGDVTGIGIQVSGGDILFGGSLTSIMGTSPFINVTGNNVTLTGVVTTPDGANASFSVGSILNVLAGANMNLGGDFSQGGAGTVNFAASFIDAAGDIAFSGAISLLADVLFDGVNLNFLNTINSSGGARNLILTGTETIAMQQAIGGTSPLASLTVNANGDMAQGRIGANINTTGSQTFNGRMEVFGPATLVSGQDVTFSDRLTIVTSANTVVDAAINALFQGIIEAAASLTVNAGEHALFAADVTTTGTTSNLFVTVGEDNGGFDEDTDLTRTADFMSNVTVGGDLDVRARGGILVAGDIATGGDAALLLSTDVPLFPLITAGSEAIAEYLAMLPAIRIGGSGIDAGGDINLGSTDPLGRLQASMDDRLRFPVGPTIIFGTAQDPTMPAAVPTFTIEANSANFGVYERVVVHGNLNIDLLGGGSPMSGGSRIFSAADLNVLGNMEVHADVVNFLARPRALTAIRGDNDMLVLVTDEGGRNRPDVGSDWVVLGITGANDDVDSSDTLVFNIAEFEIIRPEENAQFSLSLPGGRTSLGGNQVDGVTVFSPLDGPFSREDLSIISPLNSSLRLDLDIEGSGQGESPARAIAGAIAAADDLGQLPEPSTSPAEFDQALAAMGIQLLNVPPDQLIEALVGWALYNDIGSTQRGDVAEITRPRIDLTLVNRVVDAYNRLFINAEGVNRTAEIRLGIDDAVYAWQEDADTSDFDPQAFSAYLSTNDEFAQVQSDIDQLRELLDLVRLLGLTPREFEIAKQRILGLARPDSLSEEQFEAFVLGTGRNEAPAENPAP